MRILLPYPPVLNRMYRAVVIGGRARILLSSDARAYKSKVADLCVVARMRPLHGPLRIEIDAYRPRKVGDLDGALKVACDSLQGFAYDNDSQIVEILARRFDDKNRPRLEVTVSSAAATQPEGTRTSS